MSRNLARRSCRYCPGMPVMTGPAKPFAEWFPKSVYRDEYATLRLAPADCPLCEAKYVAWMPREAHGWWFSDPGEQGFVDLSFRSTFDDEPGDDDLPKWRIETKHIRVGPWGGTPPAPPGA